MQCEHRHLFPQKEEYLLEIERSALYWNVSYTPFRYTIPKYESYYLKEKKSLLY